MTMAEYRISGEGVIRNDGASIPPDATNRDWQKYLKWCEQGGIADPEPEPVVDEAAAALAALRHSGKDKIAKAAKMTVAEVEATLGPNGDPLPSL